jgi:hypothetical protein
MKLVEQKQINQRWARLDCSWDEKVERNSMSRGQKQSHLIQDITGVQKKKDQVLTLQKSIALLCQWLVNDRSRIAGLKVGTATQDLESDLRTSYAAQWSYSFYVLHDTSWYSSIMIIISKTDEGQERTGLLGADVLDEPPPAFEAGGDPIPLNFADDYSAPGGEPPPPEFSPYEAEYFRTSSGNIVSHDPHLNEDGKVFVFNV